MTTSCYLPVFYCFWLSLSTRSFLKFSLKNFRDCFIVQLSMFFVVVCHTRLLLFYHIVRCLSTTFLIYFSSSFELSAVFATAIIDYHIFMILSTTFLICFSCFLSRCTAHATACIYYHYFPGMSTPFLKYF